MGLIPPTSFGADGYTFGNASNATDATVTAQQQVKLQTRTASALAFPVPTFQPTSASKTLALDLAPSSGASSSSNNGLAWIDVCDAPAQVGSYTGHSLRLANQSTFGEVSTRKFSVSAIPLYIGADYPGSGNPQIYCSPMTNTNKNVLLGYDGSDVFIGPGTAKPLTDVRNGYFYLSTCAGTPTGVPAQATAGWTPMVFDTTGGKLWAYYGASWKSTTFA